MATMRYLIALAICSFGTALWGGPVDGPASLQREIPAAQGGEPVPLEMTIRFRGGERAIVAAQGDHDPVVPLDIKVLDANGKVVAQDQSQHDMVAVAWVPPRTAEYRVVIRHFGTVYNKVYIFIK